MKKFFNLWNVLLICSLLLCACSDNEGEGTPPPAKIELADGTSDRQEVFADQTAADNKGVSFVSQGPWKAVVEEVVKTKAEATAADWVILSQYSGDKAGSYTISITLMPNFTGKERQAVIRIICGDTEITVTVVQKGVAESGAAPKIVKEIVYTEEHGKDAFIGWRHPATETVSYSYDERGRVARITRDRQVKADDRENSFVTYEFDYDVVGEITITETEKGEEQVNKIVAKLDNLGRVIRIEGNSLEDVDAYEIGYNETGQLAKIAYIGGYLNGSWDRYSYTDGMLNKISEWYKGEENVTELSLNQLYPNRYSANTANIELNSVELFGEEIINYLYGMRLLGVGNKCLMEVALIYNDEDFAVSPEEGYKTPGDIIPMKYKSIKEREEGYDEQIYELDENNCVTKFYSYQPYKVMEVSYDIVVSSEFVDPEHPERGYKGEIKNRKVKELFEDKNTYTYTVKYKD